MTTLRKLLPVDLELYSEIELTEEEIKLALLKARQEKSAEIKRKAYAQKVMEEPKDVVYTAEQLKEMLINDSTFQIDEFNELIVWQMCLYFSNDVRSSLNKDKGLLLYGGIGCGKTTLISFFRGVVKNSFIIKSARTISYEYSQYGSESILKYNSLIKIGSPSGYIGVGICFDDLGTEVDKKHYGNESNCMAEILLNRYDNHRNLKGKTHVTTNLNTTELEERYGQRVRSRLREMFNVLIFPENSPDRRK